jgi:hypothetical protein
LTVHLTRALKISKSIVLCFRVSQSAVFGNPWNLSKQCRWDADAKGLPKLPITSVAAVLGIGAIIVELLAHAPVLSLVLPRALTYAAWFAAIGVVLDKRAEEQATR